MSVLIIAERVEETARFGTKNGVCFVVVMRFFEERGLTRACRGRLRKQVSGAKLDLGQKGKAAAATATAAGRVRGGR